MRYLVLAAALISAILLSNAEFSLPPAQRVSPVLSGPARVIDGDTLELGGTRIRLFGIDAPESDQTCGESGQIPCGSEATRALKAKVQAGTVNCNPIDRDRYGRTVAICNLGDEDLNEWMVRQGHALAYRRYSGRYVPAEVAARREGRGLWAATFVAPWDWRRQ